MKLSLLSRAFLAFWILSVGALEISAAPIKGLYSTGVNDQGLPLAERAIDPHYTISLAADPFSTSNSYAAIFNGYWAPNSSKSRWIGPKPQINLDAANPDPAKQGGMAPGYIFRTTFDLTGYDPATAKIFGRWAADNYGVRVRLNETDIGIYQVSGEYPNGFAQLNPFSITNGFIAGINVLEILVGAYYPAPGDPTGLRIEIDSATVCPPAGSPPLLEEQPLPQSSDVGGNATFRVRVDCGPTPTYQWYKNGLAIPGATGATLNLVNVQKADAGSYDVVASNPKTTRSNAALLVVHDPRPRITIDRESIPHVFLQGLPGRRYALEFKTDLLEPTWQYLTSVVLTSADPEKVEGTFESNQVFYRAVLEE